MKNLEALLGQQVSRRDALKLAGAAAFLAACGRGVQSEEKATPKPQTIEPTATTPNTLTTPAPEDERLIGQDFIEHRSSNHEYKIFRPSDWVPGIEIDSDGTILDVFRKEIPGSDLHSTMYISARSEIEGVDPLDQQMYQKYIQNDLRRKAKAIGVIHDPVVQIAFLPNDVVGFKSNSITANDPNVYTTHVGFVSGEKFWKITHVNPDITDGLFKEENNKFQEALRTFELLTTN